MVLTVMVLSPLKALILMLGSYSRLRSFMYQVTVALGMACGRQVRFTRWPSHVHASFIGVSANDGGNWTVMCPALVALPPTFSAMQPYRPSSERTTSRMLSVATVESPIVTDSTLMRSSWMAANGVSDPSFRKLTEGRGSPVALHIRVATWPFTTVTLA